MILGIIHTYACKTYEFSDDTSISEYLDRISYTGIQMNIFRHMHMCIHEFKYICINMYISQGAVVAEPVLPIQGPRYVI